MLDSRFPNMLSLSSEGLPGLDAAQLREARLVADQIHRRTGRHVCFNTHTGGLFVYLKAGDVDSGIIELPSRHWHAMPQHQIDTTCQWLQRGSMPKRLKDRLAANEKAESAKAKEQDIGMHCESAGKRADETLRRSKNRRGMSKHFRPTAMVDGLKGA